MYRRGEFEKEATEHNYSYFRYRTARHRSLSPRPMDRRPTQSGHSRDVNHLRDRFSGRPVEETVDIFTKLDRANSQPDNRALVPAYRYLGRPTGNPQENPDIKTGFNTKFNPPRQKHEYKETGNSIPRYPAYPTPPNYPSPSWTKYAPERSPQQNNEQTAPTQGGFDTKFNASSQNYGYRTAGDHDFIPPFRSPNDVPKQPPPRSNEQPAPTQPSNDQLENKVFDAVHDPSLSTKDITIRIGLPIEQDISLDLECFCRLRRLGQFNEARKVYESKLVQHNTAPYILVQYAEMLVVSGDYKSFHELTYPEESASAADHGLEINFALLGLVARSEALGYTTQAVKTVLSSMNSMKGTQLVGSTEIQMFSLCLQIICYLKSAVHKDVVGQALIDAKTVFEWKTLYSRLLGEVRIWDFRDLLVSAASLFGWEETSFLLFGSKPLDQILDMIHQDWLQTGDDEATVLGLLDIFTSLILQGRPLDSTRQPLLSSFAKHARVLADMAQKNNPDNMNTRPFIQWILAKTLTEMAPVPKRPDGVTLRNFMGLLLDQGDEIQLPVFVPIWHSSKPGWGMVSARSNPAQRAAVEVALGAAIRGDDFHLQALALKILCLQSQDPSSLLDALSTLQLTTQGDHDGFLGTWLAKYLVADNSTDHQALLETLAQSLKFADSSKLHHMANPSLVWAKNVIRDHLVASVSGKELQAPSWGDRLKKHGRNLPQYIADFIKEHYHIEVPRPSRVSFIVPEEKNRNSWEGKQPEQDMDDDDDWDYDGEGRHDGNVPIDEQRHGNTPDGRSGYVDRVRAASRAHHDRYRGYEQNQRPRSPVRFRSPDRNRSPTRRPPPGVFIPPPLVRRMNPSNHWGRRSRSPSTVRSWSPSPGDVPIRGPSFIHRQRSLSPIRIHSRERFMDGGREGQRESLESKIKFWEDGYREGYPRQDAHGRRFRWHGDYDGSVVSHDDDAYHTRIARDGHITVDDDRIQDKIRIVEAGRPQFISERVRDERPDNTVRSSGDRCGDVGYSTEVPKSVKVDNHKSELLFSSKILKDNTVTVSVRNKKDPEKVARYAIESTGVLDVTFEDENSTSRKVSGRYNLQRDAKVEITEQQAAPPQQERTPPRPTSSKPTPSMPTSSMPTSMPAPSKSHPPADNAPLDQNHSSGPSQPMSTSNDSNTTDAIEEKRAESVTKKKQHLARSTARLQIRPGSRSSRASRASKRAEPMGGGEKQNEWPTVDAEERPSDTKETSNPLSEKALNELNADSSGRQQRRRNSDTRATIASNEEAVVVDDDFDDILSVESLQESESGDNVDEDLGDVSRMQEVPKPPSRRPTVQDDFDDDSGAEKAIRDS